MIADGKPYRYPSTPSPKENDKIFKNLIYQELRTFTEYIAYTWSMIFVKNVPHVSQSHINDIMINYYHYKQKWMTRGEWVC